MASQLSGFYFYYGVKLDSLILGVYTTAAQQSIIFYEALISMVSVQPVHTLTVRIPRPCSQFKPRVASVGRDSTDGKGNESSGCNTKTKLRKLGFITSEFENPL